MKSQSKKEQFIFLRAENESYAEIAQKLGISKSTCQKWNDELEFAISEQKQENLERLYNAYFMTKESRIKKLGDSLEKIDNALEKADFSTLPADKLLDLKLKYTNALKEEFSEKKKSVFSFGL